MIFYHVLCKKKIIIMNPFKTNINHKTNSKVVVRRPSVVVRRPSFVVVRRRPSSCTSSLDQVVEHSEFSLPILVFRMISCAHIIVLFFGGGNHEFDVHLGLAWPPQVRISMSSNGVREKVTSLSNLRFCVHLLFLWGPRSEWTSLRLTCLKICLNPTKDEPYIWLPRLFIFLYKYK